MKTEEGQEPEIYSNPESSNVQTVPCLSTPSRASKPGRVLRHAGLRHLCEPISPVASCGIY